MQFCQFHFANSFSRVGASDFKGTILKSDISLAIIHFSMISIPDGSASFSGTITS